MDRREARRLLMKALRKCRATSYRDLVARVDTEDHFEIVGPSGADYQLEIAFFWDGPRGGAVRVLGSIDDGGWRAFCPLCDSFVSAPDRESIAAENA